MFRTWCLEAIEIKEERKLKKHSLRIQIVKSAKNNLCYVAWGTFMSNRSHSLEIQKG